MKQENKIVGLYPLTKFYLAIVLVVLDIIMPGILSKLVVFVIINIIAALSDVWKSFIRKVRNSVGVLFVILLFIQTFFYPRGEVIFSFWIFNAKLEGILFALKLERRTKWRYFYCNQHWLRRYFRERQSNFSE